MRKLLLAVAMLLGVSSVAMAAKAPELKVKSGEVQGIVKGQMQTFKEGDIIPDGTALTATKDAVITSGDTTISVPAGVGCQAARMDDGRLDVRSNSGGAVTVAQGGNTATLPVGAEVAAGDGIFTGISTNVNATVQFANGGSATVWKSLAAKSNHTFYVDLTTSMLPPPPNTTQNIGISPVS